MNNYTKTVRSELYSTPGDALKDYREELEDTIGASNVGTFLTWFFEILEMTDEEYEKFKESKIWEHPHQNRDRFVEGFTGTNNDIIEKYKNEVPNGEVNIESIATWLFIPVGEAGELEIQQQWVEFFGGHF